MTDRLLYAYLNPTAKLVFISVFKVTGKYKHNSKLSVQYGKARYAHRQMLAGRKTESVVKYFDDGFMLTLMNTEQKDWSELCLTQEAIAESDVNDKRDEHYQYFDRIGLREVGNRHFRSDVPTNRESPSNKWGRAKIKNMLRSQIYNEVDRMTIGRKDFEATNEFKNKVYLDCMRLPQIETKADLFIHIKQLLDN